MAKQNVLAELFYDGDWHATDAYTRDPIKITRGSGTEDSQAPPSTATLTFDNRDGSKNPRNPTSPLFGKVGRNTPIRLWAGANPVLDDTFTRSVTDQWTGGTFPWSLSGGNVPDDYDINGTKGLQTHPTANVLHYSTTDTGSTHQRVRATFNLSTGTVTGANASVWVLGRVTDTSNYYAALVNMTPAGNVTICVAKRVAGTLFISTAVTTHGGYSGFFASHQFSVELYIEQNTLSAKVWDATQSDEPTAWTVTITDSDLTTGTLAGVASRRETGNTNANLAIAYDRFTATPGPTRLTGEVASWKPRHSLGFDRVAGTGDAWCEVEAAGIRRRLGQGRDPLGSALSRAIPRANPTAYWPLEDGQTSIAATSPIPGVSPMVAFSYSRFQAPGTGAPIPAAGLVRFATGGGIPGSAPLPDMTQGGTLTAPVPAGAALTQWTVEWWAVHKRDGADPLTTIDHLSWRCQGTYVLFAANVSPTAVTVFHANADDDAIGAFTGRAQATFNAYDGLPHHYRYDTAQSGGNVQGALYIDGVLVALADNFTPPMAGTWGRVHSITVNETELQGDNMPTALGHVAVFNGGFSSVAEEPTTGYTGELAAARFLRLLDEEGIPASVVGDQLETQPMGAQYPDTLSNHLAEIEATDDGILYEPRGDRAVVLRTGRSRYNQDAVLVLDYAAGDVAPPLDPDIDDLYTRNDVTAARREGGKARAVRETGPLNVQNPEDDPDGVGRVTTQVDVNTADDGALPNHAHWHLNRGTVPDTRYARVTVDLVASPGLADAAGAVDIGDRITVLNIPDQPDPAELLVLGYTETIESHRRWITFNCVPEAPYRIGVYGDTDSRYDTAGSTVTTTTTATSWSLATTSGPLWTTRAGAFPFDVIVGGERVTVTNITGAASPQTATVTRSVNGVVKAHTVAPVRLFEQARYAL